MRHGHEMQAQLRETLAPFFLRRTKAELSEQNSRDGATSSGSALPTKRDLVVWLPLTASQVSLYRNFLDSEQVKSLLNTSGSPLAAITVLKKVCDSPDYPELKLSGSSVPRAMAEVVARSCKLRFIAQLLPQLITDGHRILIFSQSCKMLSLLQRTVIEPLDIKFLRLDGSVASPDERQRRVNEFNADPSIGCFLLSTRVGGEGLTLTGANRVLVVDPAWNPCVDAQAVRKPLNLVVDLISDHLVAWAVRTTMVCKYITESRLLPRSTGLTG